MPSLQILMHFVYQEHDDDDGVLHTPEQCVVDDPLWNWSVEGTRASGLSSSEWMCEPCMPEQQQQQSRCHGSFSCPYPEQQVCEGPGTAGTTDQVSEQHLSSSLVDCKQVNVSSTVHQSSDGACASSPAPIHNHRSLGPTRRAKGDTHRHPTSSPGLEGLLRSWDGDVMFEGLFGWRHTWPCQDSEAALSACKSTPSSLITHMEVMGSSQQQQQQQTQQTQQQCQQSDPFDAGLRACDRLSIPIRPDTQSPPQREISNTPNADVHASKNPLLQISPQPSDHAILQHATAVQPVVPAELASHEHTAHALPTCRQQAAREFSSVTISKRDTAKLLGQPYQKDFDQDDNIISNPCYEASDDQPVLNNAAVLSTAMHQQLPRPPTCSTQSSSEKCPSVTFAEMTGSEVASCDAVGSPTLCAASSPAAELSTSVAYPTLQIAALRQLVDACVAAELLNTSTMSHLQHWHWTPACACIELQRWVEDLADGSGAQQHRQSRVWQILRGLQSGVARATGSLTNQTKPCTYGKHAYHRPCQGGCIFCWLMSAYGADTSTVSHKVSTIMELMYLRGLIVDAALCPPPKLSGLPDYCVVVNICRCPQQRRSSCQSAVEQRRILSYTHVPAASSLSNLLTTATFNNIRS